jgi:serine/threonine protein kinase
LAIDPQLQRPVALKVPHFGVDEQPKSITRILREAKAGAGLHHPNIVAVHDAGRHNENFCIASAFVDRSSLREKMKADGKPSKKAAVKLIAKLGNALGYANEQGVVHRDVKPENILLQNDGTLLLRLKTQGASSRTNNIHKQLDAPVDESSTQTMGSVDKTLK